MLRRINCVTAVVVLLLMCTYGFCHDPKHLNNVQKEAWNRSLMFEPIRFPMALELSTEHEGNYQLSSKWKTMRIRSSSKTVGSLNYVCPTHYTSRSDWAYNLKTSWEWCGEYCESGGHTNYVTQDKRHLLQTVIIPSVFKNLLETAPLIRHVPTNLIFDRPVDNSYHCGYIKADDSHYRLGIPNTDLMVHFSLSPFLYAERKSLVWGMTCNYYEGRISGLVININPCWMINNVNETIDAALQEIKKELHISTCPENSILLHGAKEWYTNVVLCVEVKCKSDKTFEVRFKDGNWISCPDHHVLGVNKGTEVHCPKFDEVCEEADKNPNMQGIAIQKAIEAPVIEEIVIEHEEDEPEVPVTPSNPAVPGGPKSAQNNATGSANGQNAAPKKPKKSVPPVAPPPTSQYNVTVSDKALLDGLIQAAQAARDSSPMKAPYYAVISAICAFLLTVIA